MTIEAIVEKEINAEKVLNNQRMEKVNNAVMVIAAKIDKLLTTPTWTFSSNVPYNPDASPESAFVVEAYNAGKFTRCFINKPIVVCYYFNQNTSISKLNAELIFSRLSSIFRKLHHARYTAVGGMEGIIFQYPTNAAFKEVYHGATGATGPQGPSNWAFELPRPSSSSTGNTGPRDFTHLIGATGCSGFVPASTPSEIRDKDTRDWSNFLG